MTSKTTNTEKEDDAAYEKRWHSKNELWFEKCRKARERERILNRIWRFKQYGITEDDYRVMFDAQQGCCAICGVKRALNIDHNRKTKKIRELLCTPCNTTLGVIKEDADRLEKMIAYIKKHEKRNLSSSD